MTIESATYVDELDASYPETGTVVSDGDNHLRLIKTVLKASFPNVSGAVAASDVELSYVDGVTSAIQTQLNNLASVTQQKQNANYELVLTDANKHVYKDDTTAYAWTVPPNASKAFPTGTVVTMINGGSAGAITVTRGSGVAILLAGDGTDSDKTLAAYGVATLIKVDTNTWFISGTGVT